MEEQDVKSKILKGASELFMRYGLRSVTMDELARHLSISKKTIYQYFSDKDDIVTSVTQAILDHDRQTFLQLEEEANDVVEELVKISICLRQEMKEMNPSLLFDLKKYHPKSWEIWLDYKNVFIRQKVVKNITEGIEQGFFREGINPEILAILRLETVQLGFDDHVFSREKHDLTEIQMQLLEHFVYGLFTDKGRKLYNKYKKAIKETTY